MSDEYFALKQHKTVQWIPMVNMKYGFVNFFVPVASGIVIPRTFAMLIMHDNSEYIYNQQMEYLW